VQDRRIALRSAPAPPRGPAPVVVVCRSRGSPVKTPLVNLDFTEAAYRTYQRGIASDRSVASKVRASLGAPGPGCKTRWAACPRKPGVAPPGRRRTFARPVAPGNAWLDTFASTAAKPGARFCGSCGLPLSLRSSGSARACTARRPVRRCNRPACG
jgi:hypothetical protein